MRGIVLIAVALTSTIALAGELSPEAKASAKQHYEAGERAFRVGEFQRAVTEWKASFDASGEALLLYNIGQAYRQLGDYHQAVFFYRQFLAASDARQRERKIAQQKIAELEPLLEAQRKAQESPPTGTAGTEKQPAAIPPPTPTERATEARPQTVAPTVTAPAIQSAEERRRSERPIYKRWWLWTTVGAVVVAGVAVGLGVGLSRGPTTPTADTTNGTFQPF